MSDISNEQMVDLLMMPDLMLGCDNLLDAAVEMQVYHGKSVRDLAIHLMGPSVSESSDEVLPPQALLATRCIELAVAIQRLADQSRQTT